MQLHPLLCCHRQDEVGNAAPQPAVLVDVHPVEGRRPVLGQELLLEVVVHHLLHGAQARRPGDLVLLLQQHGEDQEDFLVGGVLVVTVAVEDEGGAGRQLLEAVNDGDGFVPLERPLQLPVDVQFDAVAVLAGGAGAVDVEDGGVDGGGEGGGQTLSQAAQRPLRFEPGRQDEADGLGGAERLQVPLHVDPVSVPQLGALVRKPSLHRFHLLQEDVHRTHVLHARRRTRSEEGPQQDGQNNDADRHHPEPQGS